MRGLREAAGLFTLIPVPAFDLDRTAGRRAMAAMPWLGLLLGAAAGLVYAGVSLVASPLLGAVLGLAVLAAVTGALHLDGVADTADALGSRKPAEQALAIMKRSDIGPMGVVTLLFVLLIDITATVSLPGSFLGAAAIACAAMAGRAQVMLATVSPDSARQGGFGAFFVGVTSRRSAAINLSCTVALTLALGWLAGGLGGLIALAVARALTALVAHLWARHLLHRIGGWTGDLFGSVMEISQATFLVAAALTIGAVG